MGGCCSANSITGPPEWGRLHTVKSRQPIWPRAADIIAAALNVVAVAPFPAVIANIVAEYATDITLFTLFRTLITRPGPIVFGECDIAAHPTVSAGLAIIFHCLVEPYGIGRQHRTITIIPFADHLHLDFFTAGVVMGVPALHITVGDLWDFIAGFPAPSVAIHMAQRTYPCAAMTGCMREAILDWFQVAHTGHPSPMTDHNKE